MNSAEINMNQRIKDSHETCDNCGRSKHESPLFEQFLDGDNQPVMIEVCKHYRKLKIKKETSND